MKQNTRFMYRSAKTKDRLLIEAVLPSTRNLFDSLLNIGGSITHVFRNLGSRAIVLQGKTDRVKWTIRTEMSGQEDLSDNDEVLQIRVPLGYDLDEMGIIEKFEKGRILLSFPAS